jgi:hypothetical protein
MALENDGTVSTRLFRKPTDGHQYVHWSSAHPEALKSSIPFAQLLRIKRNCSKDADYQSEAIDLLYRFRLRGYPADILDAAWRKAELTDRAALLITGQPKQRDERLTFVTDNLNGAAKEMRAALRKFYTGLLEDPLITETAELFGPVLPSEPPRLASRTGSTFGASAGKAYRKKCTTAEDQGAACG